MPAYKNILVAVDLSAERTSVLDKAREIAAHDGATLHLVHVMEWLPPAYTLALNQRAEGIYREARERCRQRLLEIAAGAGIDASRVHGLLGNPATEVHRLAKEIGADLVVTGSHGKHGLALLLGSTSSAIAHGIPCDMLIVRLDAEAASP